VKGDKGDTGAGFNNLASATVATSQERNNTAYGDCATVGPSVTVTISSSGKALVTLTALIDPASSTTAWMSFAVSGATTLAASDTMSLAREHGTSSSTGYIQASAVYVVTGLTAGSNTFTAKYRVSNTSDTDAFANRSIIVVPLP
jgi:hypothetical protein